MKKSLLSLMALSVMAFAVDYSAMSATELAAMRSSVPAEDRAAFQAAMQSKMQALSPDERAAAMNQAPANSPGKKNMGGNAGSAGSSSGGNSGGGGKGGGNGNGGRGGR
ncbi:MAG: hypothetical protein KBE79_07500 [Sulfurospirillum sp.]|jgi:uncharacterized membrane protein YgcG|nr:hypothetical protein [Sulfurospirillum sp.]MBP9613353.1 hypothetical protein [Sulfurospirillum sp.]